MKRAEYISRKMAEPWRQAPTKGVDSGAFGKASEVALRRKGSTVTKCAGPGQADGSFRYNGKNHPFESKTNGGRYTLATLRTGFVCYTLDVCNANTKGIRHVAINRLMTAETFAYILDLTGALRWVKNSRNNDGWAIQHTIKAFMVIMEEWPLVLDQCREYTSADFEGELDMVADIVRRYNLRVKS